MLQKKELNFTKVTVSNITFYGRELYFKFTLTVNENESYELVWVGHISRSEEAGFQQKTFDFTNFFDTRPFDEVVRMRDGYIESVHDKQLTQRYKLNDDGDIIIPDNDRNYIFYIATAISSYAKNNVDTGKTSTADICFIFPKNEKNSVKIFDEIGREVESRILVFSEAEKRRIQDAIIRYIRN